MRVLLLGGSAEASSLAKQLAGDSRFSTTISLAGRTAAPRAQPLPTRIGGFGGISGLVDYLTRNRIDVLVDATHPFAAQMSRNAVEACALTRTPLLALERPAWQANPGDNWVTAASLPATVAALARAPRIVFCGIGRLALADLRAAPQHHYIIRLIDAPAEPLDLPRVTIVQARGPFKLDEDLRLFQNHGVEAVLAKNSGGEATVSKIEAARQLGLPVFMAERPFIPARPIVPTVEQAFRWLEHQLSSMARGV
jgi:precorrin-6A/cobalt-precorrin-6A reductase